MASRTIADFDVTIPDPGDLISGEIEIPVASLMAYGVDRLPDSWASGLVETARETEGEGLRGSAAQVRVDGQWVDL